MGRPIHREMAETGDTGDRDQPPIGDFALAGDCRTAALVSRAGSVDWFCLPDYSSSSLFAHILDSDCGGTFSIRPAGAFASKRRYVSATPVLETTFEAESGSARLIDLLPAIDGVTSLQPMRELLRIVEGISGALDLEIRIDPRPDYARAIPRLWHRKKLGWSYAWSNEILAVRSDVDLRRMGNTLHGSVRVHAGERVRLSLCYAKGDIGVLSLLGGHADERLDKTLRWWQGWSDTCTYRGPYRHSVLRSALTLKLLSFSLSGAIIAAPTTSLPETIGGARNWDYRYCWLRDAGLTMQAFVGLGFQDEARSFLTWLLHATRLTWPELQVVYDVYGRTNLRERELDHLRGYRGSRPVRIGNAVYAQHQLDVYGEVIVAAHAYVAAGGELEPLECRMLKGFAKVVCKSWRQPDHGLWEARRAPRQYTFSKVMCWVALDRLLELGRKGIVRLGSLTEHFHRERDAIAGVIEQRGYDQRIASYVSELDGGGLDASLLLMPCVGYRPADEGRLEATYRRVTQELGRNGLIYRYPAGSDGLGGREGAFGLCSFWAVHNLACRGHLAEAKDLFEHVLSFANELGLFSEEIDPDTGALLGNFPQAFTHVGLINAALAIERASKKRSG